MSTICRHGSQPLHHSVTPNAMQRARQPHDNMPRPLTLETTMGAVRSLIERVLGVLLP